MIYAYEIKKTSDGYVGHVFDLEFETKPQPSAEQVEEVICEGLSGVIELKYRKNKKPIPLPTTEVTAYGAVVPIKLQLRILLWNIMLEEHVSQTELAEALGISKSHMNQFFISDHVSVEKYEKAINNFKKDITVKIMNNKKTKLKTFIKNVSGNFLVRDSRSGIVVYSSKERGPNSLDFFYNMTVKDHYADKDNDGDAVLVIVIDSWDN